MRFRPLCLAVLVTLAAPACGSTAGNPTDDPTVASSARGDPLIAAGPAAIEFAEVIGERLGRAGLDAVLLAMGQGYDADQLLAGGRAGELMADGTITGSAGPVTPSGPALLVIVPAGEEALGDPDLGRDLVAQSTGGVRRATEIVLVGDVSTTTIGISTLREFAIERAEAGYSRDPEYDYGNPDLNRPTIAFIGAFFEQGFSTRTVLEVVLRGSEGGAFNRPECPFVLVDGIVLYGANRVDPSAGCPATTDAATEEPREEPTVAPDAVVFPHTVRGSIEVDPDLLAPGDALTSDVTLTLSDDGTFTSTWLIELIELSSDVASTTTSTIDGEWSTETGLGQGTGTQETTVTNLATDEADTTTADVAIELALRDDGTVAIGQPGDALYVVLMPAE